MVLLICREAKQHR